MAVTQTVRKPSILHIWQHNSLISSFCQEDLEPVLRTSKMFRNYSKCFRSSEFVKRSKILCSNELYPISIFSLSMWSWSRWYVTCIYLGASVFLLPFAIFSTSLSSGGKVNTFSGNVIPNSTNNHFIQTHSRTKDELATYTPSEESCAIIVCFFDSSETEAAEYWTE